jgi:hypothetical protein
LSKIRANQKVNKRKNMIFILASIKLLGKNGFGKKKYFKKNFGTKSTEKIRLNRKNLKDRKCKSSDFSGGTTRTNYLYARKKISEKKIILWSVEVERHAFFQKSQKKAKKRTLSRCQRPQISLSCKIKYTTHLRIFFSTI